MVKHDVESINSLDCNQVLLIVVHKLDIGIALFINWLVAMDGDILVDWIFVIVWKENVNVGNVPVWASFVAFLDKRNERVANLSKVGTIPVKKVFNFVLDSVG